MKHPIDMNDLDVQTIPAIVRQVVPTVRPQDTVGRRAEG